MCEKQKLRLRDLERYKLNLWQCLLCSDFWHMCYNSVHIYDYNVYDTLKWELRNEVGKYKCGKIGKL